jgi:hypothetical protein
MGLRSMRAGLKRSGCDCRDRGWIFDGMEVLEVLYDEVGCLAYRIELGL